MKLNCYIIMRFWSGFSDHFSILLSSLVIYHYVIASGLAISFTVNNINDDDELL